MIGFDQLVAQQISRCFYNAQFDLETRIVSESRPIFPVNNIMESPEAFCHPPTFDVEHAEDIARVHFGHSGKATSLPSERDQNFKIKALSGPDVVLKIANPNTPPSLLELENSALQIAEPIRSFESPRLIRTKANSPMVTIRDPSGKDCFVRMISFLEGQKLAGLTQLPKSACFHFGEALAHLDLGLQHLNHQVSAKRQMKWDLDAGPSTVRLCLEGDSELFGRDPDYSPATKRTLLESYLKEFEKIESRIPDFPKAVIHNDANDHNVLVNSSDSLCDLAPIGLIDFGDMMFTTQVNELAIAAAYLLLRQDWTYSFTQLVRGYHQHRPLSADELSAIFPLSLIRLCQSVCIAAEQRKLQPDNEYLSVTEKPAWQTLSRLTKVKHDEIQSMITESCFGRDELSENAPEPFVRFAESDSTVSPLHRRRQEAIGPSLSLSYTKPLHIVRGKGQYLYDPSDITYLDCVNNVCHVGHCNPHVVSAIQQQAALLNTNTRYLHENIVRYAERITDKLPDSLSVCYFVNSGSEANDLALRMAKAHSGASDTVVLDHAYHGHTSALIDISPYKFRRKGGQGNASHVHVLPLPDGFRGKFRSDRYPDDWQNRFAEDAVKQIEDLTKSGRKIGSFFAESLPGCGGQIVLPDGYLKQVYPAIREAGGLCIADEVQVGFGRVGDKFWGFELQEVVPDIVTLGKPIGNGHPLAAVVTTRAVAEAFANGMEYFNTFGGNPVSCAVGMAVLDEIENKELQQHAKKVGDELLTKLIELKSKFNFIGDVRGHGLFLGIEFVRPGDERTPAPRLAKQIVERMKGRRILLSTDGPDENVIKFKPPMVFSAGDADRLVMTLEEELARGLNE